MAELYPERTREEITIYHKITAVLTAVLFLFNTIGTDLAWAVNADSLSPRSGERDRVRGTFGARNDISIDSFQIPAVLGEIKDKFKGRAGTIIYIQDAHCNYAAQKAISDIINHLNENYGVKLINLEGGAGDYDLSLFTDIKEKGVREKVTDHFVKEGRVSGPEYFAINNTEKVTLFGVEDPDLYIKNLDVYRDSLKYITGVNETLDHILSRIDELKGRVYNDALLKLDNEYRNFKDEKVELKEFIQRLFGLSLEKGISLKNLPNIRSLCNAISKEREIDFKKANNERDKLIEELKEVLPPNGIDRLTLKSFLFKTGQLSQASFYNYLKDITQEYRLSLKGKDNLTNYIVYINLYEESDKQVVFNEIEDLYELIAEKEFENDTQKSLFRTAKHARILKNIFNIKATKREINYFNKYKREFEITAIMEFLEREFLKLGESPTFDQSASLISPLPPKGGEGKGEGVLIDMHMDEILNFYKYALARDEVFVKNITQSHKRFAKDTSIVVAGGFHHENLTQILKNNDYSYIVIRPTFKNGDGYKCPYYKLLSGGLSDMEEEIVAAISAIALASLLNHELAGWVYGGELTEELEKLQRIKRQIFEQGQSIVVEMPKGVHLKLSRPNGKLAMEPTKEEAELGFTKTELDKLIAMRGVTSTAPLPQAEGWGEGVRVRGQVRTSPVTVRTEENKQPQEETITRRSALRRILGAAAVATGLTLIPGDSAIEPLEEPVRMLSEEEKKALVQEIGTLSLDIRANRELLTKKIIQLMQTDIYISLKVFADIADKHRQQTHMPLNLDLPECTKIISEKINTDKYLKKRLVYLVSTIDINAAREKGILMSFGYLNLPPDVTDALALRLKDADDKLKDELLWLIMRNYKPPLFKWQRAKTRRLIEGALKEIALQVLSELQDAFLYLTPEEIDNITNKINKKLTYSGKNVDDGITMNEDFEMTASMGNRDIDAIRHEFAHEIGHNCLALRGIGYWTLDEKTIHEFFAYITEAAYRGYFVEKPVERDQHVIAGHQLRAIQDAWDERGIKPDWEKIGRVALDKICKHKSLKDIVTAILRESGYKGELKAKRLKGLKRDIYVPSDDATHARTSPLQPGLCVTGDTLLTLEDGREIPIVAVRPGDYVLSLNEATGSIEPHRINGLLDMGIKPVYRLTTASDRSIKTTANHPYLTQDGWIKVSKLRIGKEIAVPRSLKDPSLRSGSIRPYDLRSLRSVSHGLIDLKVGDEIAVPDLESMDSVPALLDNGKTAEKIFFRDTINKVFNNTQDFINRKQINPKKNNPAIRADRVTKDISKIGIAGNEDERPLLYQFIDFLIRGGGFDVSNVFNFMAGCFKGWTDTSGAVGINEKFHNSLYPGRLANQLLLISEEGRIQDACPNVVYGNRGKLFFDSLKGHSRGQCFEDHVDRRTNSLNTGPSVLNIRINKDMLFEQTFITPLSHIYTSFCALLYHAAAASKQSLSASRNLLSKVAIERACVWQPRTAGTEPTSTPSSSRSIMAKNSLPLCLMGFLRIFNLASNKNNITYPNRSQATLARMTKCAYAEEIAGSGILWNRVISIEYIGYEHVYDIEVEGTHNFIGNGIFAHNTYIQTPAELEVGSWKLEENLPSTFDLRPSTSPEARTSLAQAIAKRPLSRFNEHSFRYNRAARKISEEVLTKTDILERSARQIFGEDIDVSYGVDVESVAAKHKRLVKATVRLRSGRDVSILIFIEDTNIPHHYITDEWNVLTAVDGNDAAKGFVSRVGVALTEEEIARLEDFEGKMIFSAEFLEGHTYNKLRSALETVCGIRGIDGYLRSYEGITEKSSTEMTGRAKERLIGLGLIDRETMASMSIDELRSYARNLLISLDTEAIRTYIALYKAMDRNISIRDVRAENVMARRVDGKWVFKLFDFENWSIGPTAPSRIIGQFEVFKEKEDGATTGILIWPYLLRGWYWSRLRDKRGFFEAILSAFPDRERGLAFLQEAADGLRDSGYSYYIPAVNAIEGYLALTRPGLLYRPDAIQRAAVGGIKEAVEIAEPALAAVRTSPASFEDLYNSALEMTPAEDLEIIRDAWRDLNAIAKGDIGNLERMGFEELAKAIGARELDLTDEQIKKADPLIRILFESEMFVLTPAWWVLRFIFPHMKEEFEKYGFKLFGIYYVKAKERYRVFLAHELLEHHFSDEQIISEAKIVDSKGVEIEIHHANIFILFEELLMASIFGTDELRKTLDTRMAGFDLKSLKEHYKESKIAKLYVDYIESIADSFKRSPEDTRMRLLAMAREKFDEARTSPVKVYSNIHSLNWDISGLESTLRQMGLGKLPRIGIHGEQTGHQPAGEFWYFVLDPELEDYWTPEWRDNHIDAKFKLRRGELSLNDVFMGPAEFFERLQGTIIFTSDYARPDLAKGVLPEIYLLVNVPGRNFELTDLSAEKEDAKVFVYNPETGDVEYRFLHVEGRKDVKDIPGEAIVAKISLTQEEFAAITQWADTNRSGVMGANFFVCKLLYKKALEEIIAIAAGKVTSPVSTLESARTSPVAVQIESTTPSPYPSPLGGEGITEGLCVTGDTLLMLEGGRRIPIVDIKTGDYVLSLNEATSEIEPHRINGLLDMGIKPAYRLTTASGRSIKTTANHPYLVKIKEDNGLWIVDSGKKQKHPSFTPNPLSTIHNPLSNWVKVRDLRVGDEIAVPSGSFRRTAWPDDLDTLFSYDHKGIFEAVEHLSFYKDLQDIEEGRGNKRVNSKERNTFVCPQGKSIEVTKVGIKGDDNSLFFVAERDDFFVARLLQPYIRCLNDIVTGFTQKVYTRGEETMVGKEPHLIYLLYRDFLILKYIGGVMEAGFNIFGGKVGIAVFYNFFRAQSLLNEFKDHINRNSRSPDTRFPKAYFGINSNPSVIHKFLTPLTNKYSIFHSNLSRFLSGSIAYAEKAPGSAILWDRIASIEYIGYEHVYDIEVEGTHNFIGNGIFAHNTYMGATRTSPVKGRAVQIKCGTLTVVGSVTNVVSKASVNRGDVPEELAPLVEQHNRLGANNAKMVINYKRWSIFELLFNDTYAAKVIETEDKEQERFARNRTRKGGWDELQRELENAKKAKEKEAQKSVEAKFEALPAEDLPPALILVAEEEVKAFPRTQFTRKGFKFGDNSFAIGTAGVNAFDDGNLLPAVRDDEITRISFGPLVKPVVIKDGKRYVAIQGKLKQFKKGNTQYQPYGGHNYFSSSFMEQKYEQLRITPEDKKKQNEIAVYLSGKSLSELIALYDKEELSNAWENFVDPLTGILTELIEEMTGFDLEGSAVDDGFALLPKDAFTVVSSTRTSPMLLKATPSIEKVLQSKFEPAPGQLALVDWDTGAAYFFKEFLLKLTAFFPGAQINARAVEFADSSRPWVEEARNNIEDARKALSGNSTVDFYLAETGEYERYPESRETYIGRYLDAGLKESSQDLVILNNISVLAGAREKLIERISDILKPNGLLIITFDRRDVDIDSSGRVSDADIIDSNGRVLAASIMKSVKQKLMDNHFKYSQPLKIPSDYEKLNEGSEFPYEVMLLAWKDDWQGPPIIEETESIHITPPSAAEVARESARTSPVNAIPELKVEDMERYLSAETGVYGAIVGGQAFDLTNGDALKRGGLLGEINNKNGLGAERKYVVIVGGENVVPQVLEKEDRDAFQRSIDEVTDLFRQEGYRNIQVEAVPNSEELAKFLEEHKDALQNNTFIYYDTNVAAKEDISGKRDTGGEGYMAARLDAPHEEEKKGYVSMGGLLAFAIAAMAIARPGEHINMEDVYRILAALQETDIKEIRDMWEKETEKKNRSSLEYLISAELSVRMFPVVNKELGEYYKKEREVSQVL